MYCGGCCVDHRQTSTTSTTSTDPAAPDRDMAANDPVRRPFHRLH